MSKSPRLSAICILSFLLWLSIFSIGFGQSYNKFIQPGKVWETTYSGGGDCGAYRADIFFIADDTLINGISYSKLKIKSMDYPSNYPYRCVSVPQTTSSVFAYIREDTIAHKVYEVVKNNTSWIEGLYMDFSLSVGDSVPFGISKGYSSNSNLSPYPLFKGDTVVLYLKVKSVDTTKSSGYIPNGRKVIRFLNSNQFIVNDWIEGIGGVNIPSGFFPNFLPEYSQNITNITFNNKVTKGELVLGLEPDSNPDPNIGLIPDDFTQVDIYDAQGLHISTIYDKHAFSDFCASPPSGMLVLKTTSRNSVSVKKVVFSR